MVAGVCVALVALIFAVFGQTVHFAFINRDDPDYLYNNPVISKGLSLSGIGWAFTHVVSGHWHPLTVIVLMLDCQLFGLWPGGHHLVNVAIHAATAVLLFLMLLELTGALGRCAFVAAVFAIHPLRAESVAWVAECKDVLSAMFFMLTLRAYVRYARRPQSWPRYAMVLIWFALGLMSKPMLVTVPCVLLLLDYWPLGRWQRAGQLPKLLLEKAPMFVLTALSSIATVFALKSDNPTTYSYLANPPVAITASLWKLIYPVHLAAIYPWPPHGWPPWEIFNACVFVGALTTGAYLLRRTKPYLLVGWLWYIGMLFPVTGLLQTGTQAYADRYTYLPGIGISIAVTWLAADWAGGQNYRRITLGVIAGALFCILSIACWRQVGYWRNSVAIWTHTIENTKNSFIAYNGLGEAFFQQGQFENALAAYRASDKSVGIDTVGNTELQQGRIQDAALHFRAAVRIDPGFADAHNNLGYALYWLGQVDQAISEYQEALRLDPALVQAHDNLGGAFFSQGRLDEAITQFREALRLNPSDPKVHNNLGGALFAHGKADDAIAEFQDALRLDPTFAEAHYNFANALLQLQRTDEAIAEYRRVLQIDPSYHDAFCNLGIALLDRGRIEEAIAAFNAALKTQPANTRVENYLANALFQQGRSAEAIGYLEKAIELDPDNQEVQGNLAWMLASAPDRSLRNGPKALELALRLDKTSGGTNTNILHTLAAAYAQCGDFADALHTAQSALRLANAQSDDAFAKKIRADITLYQAGRAIDDGRSE